VKTSDITQKPKDSATQKGTCIHRYLGTKNYHPSGPHNGNRLIIICDIHVHLILELNNSNNKKKSLLLSKQHCLLGPGLPM